ncbi:histidine kinase-DNA gyrase B-and HSP90-like ATPase-domain-containing protein [Cladochytrium replicatum]|nr:histidine kinase-DNA gyrase B-and HSP90-like ATPase-domain-containing protein [Cladochytrium replicatum]
MFDLRHPPDGLKWPKLDALPSLPLKGFDPLPHPLPVRKNLSNIVRFEIVEGSQNDDRDPYSLTTECQEPVDMPSARPRTLTITNHHIRSVQSIIVSTQHMLALVNDMLEIGANECTTRKELRKMVRPVEVNLVELLTGKIFPLLKSAAESNDVRLTAAAEPSLPQLVVIDPDRLEQIIGNLLGHSFKNTSPHSRIDVRVASRLRRGLEDDTSTLEFGGEWRNASLELQRVESICAIPMHRDPPSSPDRDLEMQRFVPAESTWTSSSHSRTHNIYAQALRPSERYISTDSRLGTVTSLNESNATTTPTTEYDEELVLQIRTYGRGIPSEKLEALFEPYTQASLANEREVGGSGLGLAVTYLLVKAMGGRVTARSREGEGISMTVVLPLVRASFEGDNQTRSVLSGEGEQDSESERKLGEDAGKVFSEVTLGGTSSCDLSIGAISGKPSMLAVQPASEPSHIVHDGQMLSVSKTSPNQYEVRQEPAIPILNPPKATESVALGTTQDPEHNALRNVVMVVEDEPINRRILVRILKKLLPTTFIIKEAEDGLQAVRLLNPSFHEHAEDEQGGSTPIILDFGLPPTTIACVLLDVVMPRMDGYEAARHLRLLGCNAPIVVTTANEATGTREKFEKELENAGLKGIEGAMQKPFGRADVERALRKCAVLEKELN